MKNKPIVSIYNILKEEVNDCSVITFFSGHEVKSHTNLSVIQRFTRSYDQSIKIQTNGLRLRT